ncbi:hypothetical protein [Candidatus Uabimicrobium amorphum]|uniref:Uncharacterized protein n=1 Tax=Uabimicrobium amorphum TaxID=2596890 RepID=A0A5S9F412_UABAM|nr:hypothetical protein [Candidatus Uabimicrobium amorphum]BBM85052.1 hypothetical protein UABAM_03415 [Candidatus Uabimicrobium amorphum]
MYRFNGVSMPGFGVGVLLAIVLGFVGYGFGKVLTISIATWIAIDVITIVQIVVSKKNEKNDAQELE